uniref:Uncharacterized protein n=1 Tax=Syphacia muris TaxID=451379 RepID=A0A0N5AR77_9BILA
MYELLDEPESGGKWARSEGREYLREEKQHVKRLVEKKKSIIVNDERYTLKKKEKEEDEEEQMTINVDRAAKC